MTSYIYANYLKRTIKYFKKRTLAKSIISLSFLSLVLLFAYGIYLFFTQGFYYISAERDILEALLLYFYEIFFLVLGAIIFFSSLVTGMFSLWRGKSDSWFMSSPGYKHLPKVVFLKTIISGSWPLFVVMVPVILAYNKVFGLSLLGFLSILFSFFLFLAFLTSLALLMILLISYLYYQLDKKISFIKISFARVFVVLLASVLLFSVFVWEKSLSIDFIDLFGANRTGVVEVSLSSVSDFFNYLPSHPVALNTLYWQIDYKQAGSKYLFYVSALALLSVFIWWRLSDLFLPLWQKMREGNLQADYKNKTGKRKKGVKFYGKPSLALFKKEFILIVRNPRNLIWFSFLVFIWLIQAAINAALARNIAFHELDPSLRQTVIQSLQFVVATYFISAFVLRFVFPAFSSERKTLWILSSAPVNNTKIFYIKYIFYGTLFLILGLALGYVNLIGLNLDWVYVTETLLLFSVATLFITALGLSLGAIFPNYDTDDPGAMSTTLPGIFLIISSLIYGSVGGASIYLAQDISSHTPIYGFIVASIILMTAILYFTPRLSDPRNKLRQIIS